MLQRSVVYDSSSFVVVDKPAGVQVIPTVDNVLENVLACTTQVGMLYCATDSGLVCYWHAQTAYSSVTLTATQFALLSRSYCLSRCGWEPMTLSWFWSHLNALIMTLLAYTFIVLVLSECSHQDPDMMYTLPEHFQMLSHHDLHRANTLPTLLVHDTLLCMQALQLLKPLLVTHRLDSCTQGLVVLGKTVAFVQLFNKLLQQSGAIRKFYRTLTQVAPSLGMLCCCFVPVT